MAAFCTKQDLFGARTNGYHVYRIPGLTMTPRGVVLAYTEVRRGRGRDWDPIDIRMRRSTDGGLSWEPPFTAIDHRDFERIAPQWGFSSRVVGVVAEAWSRGIVEIGRSELMAVLGNGEGPTATLPNWVVEARRARV